MELNLSERQKRVLQCVIDAANEKKKPYTKGVANRMRLKGFEITDRQCSYDLGVIIHTVGSGVYSVRYGNAPALWIYDAETVKDGEP